MRSIISAMEIQRSSPVDRIKSGDVVEKSGYVACQLDDNDSLSRARGPAEELSLRLNEFLNRLNDLPDFRGDHFHPSSIGKLCPRLEALKLAYPIRAEKVRPGMRELFDVGHSLHDWYRNKYFGPMGVLVGRWQCSRCHKIKEGLMPKNPCECQKSCTLDCVWPGGFEAPNRDCVTCGKWGEWKYKEYKFHNEEWNIGGSTDGMLQLADGKRRLLEIKTINDRGFGQLQITDDTYLYQINCYMWLSGVNEAVIIYIDKNTSERKQFTVEFKERRVVEFKNRIVIINDLRSKRQNNEAFLLPRGICGSPDDTIAKYCPGAVKCFESGVDDEFYALGLTWGHDKVAKQEISKS